MHVSCEVLLFAVFIVVLFQEGIKRLQYPDVYTKQFEYKLVILLWNIENTKHLLSFVSL